MAEPERPYADEPYSVIEELDPEPIEGRERGKRRDLLMGALLLLVVVAFALWQWWWQDYQSGRYRAGQEAAVLGDIDTALSFYSEASGFSNADALFKSTQEQIERRDRLYGAAESYASEGQWLPALRDLREVARIQPDYNDLAEREEAALLGIYDEALVGIVARRDDAKQPGLYHRAPNGWERLEGSDSLTRVLAGDGRDHVLFDVAAQGWDIPTAANVISEYQPKGPFENRQLMSAHFTRDEPDFAPVTMDPSYYTPIIAGSGGVWGAHRGGTESFDYIIPIVRDFMPTAEMQYQPYSGEQGVLITLEATEAYSTGSAIVSVDPDSNRYLLAEWTGAGGSGANFGTEVKIYLGAAGSDEKRLVYSHTGGGLESAQISPDGRYVVLHALSEGVGKLDGEILDMAATMLVDVETGKSVMLDRVFRSRNPDRQPQGEFNAGFVRGGAFSGKLVFAQFLGDSTELKIIDPASATRDEDPNYDVDSDYVVAQASVEGNVYAPWIIRQQDTLGLTLSRQTYAMINSPYASMLDIVIFPTGKPAETYKVSAERVTNVQSVRTTGCHLYWHELEYESAQGKNPPANVVYMLHRKGENAEQQPHRRVFTTSSLKPSRDWASDAVYLGDSLIAYAADGELRARAYDGDLDILLETGISPMFANATPNYYADRLR